MFVAKVHQARRLIRRAQRALWTPFKLIAFVTFVSFLVEKADGKNHRQLPVFSSG